MKRPPRPPGQSVFSDGRGMHMIWVGLLMAGIALAAQSWAIKNGLHWQTIVFNVLCLAQMGHVLAIRSNSASFFSSGIFSNKLLLLSVLITLLLQAVITYAPFFQPVFKTESLSLKEFLIAGAASSLVFVAVELEKMISRIRKKREKATEEKPV